MHGHDEGCAYLLTNDKRDCACEMRRYGKAAGITALVFAGQLLVALYSGSLVLLSDTVHVSSDLTVILASLVVAFASVRMSDTNEARIRTFFGYAGIALLAAGAFYVWSEAHERLIAPHMVANEWVVFTGVLGGAGNYAVYRILHAVPGGEQTITHNVLDAHVLSDLMLSVVVVLSALLSLAFGWTLLDPLGSIAIAGYMLFLAGRLSQRIGGRTHEHHHH